MTIFKQRLPLRLTERMQTVSIIHRHHYTDIKYTLYG